MTFELVDCEPYRARLTKARCVERFVLARSLKRKAPPGSRAIERAGKLERVRHCVGCAVGAERERS